MKRILEWIKQRASGLIMCIFGGITFVLTLLLIETILEGFGVFHAIEEPKGKLARLLYISETARMPLLIGFAIILSPITLIFKINERFFKPKKEGK